MSITWTAYVVGFGLVSTGMYLITGRVADALIMLGVAVWLAGAIRALRP